MTANITKSPFLRTQRTFPQTAQELSVELNRSYVDIAQNVNARTLGIFATGNQLANGEYWYLQGNTQRQQGLREVYIFTSFSAITHGINIANISEFIRIFGTFSDASGNSYPLPFVASTAANQVGVTVTPTQITFDAGAGSPTPVSGVIVLEWIGNV